MPLGRELRLLFLKQGFDCPAARRFKFTRQQGAETPNVFGR
jgi:hypothetical protein